MSLVPPPRCSETTRESLDGCDARQAAVHHRVGIAACGQERTNHEAARLHLIVDQRRRRAGHHLFLRDVLLGMRLDARAEFFDLRAGERPAENRVLAERRVRGLDHHLGKIFEHVLAIPWAGRTTTWAPSGSFKSSPSRCRQSPGRNGRKSRRLENAGAERVGDRDVALADRLQQTRHAEIGAGKELQRIAVIVVHAAQDHVHALQAADRLQIDLRVADGEIVALHQRIAEISRQEGMLEVGFVVRAGRQQDDARIVGDSQEPAKAAYRAALRKTARAAARCIARNMRPARRARERCDFPGNSPRRKAPACGR